MTYDRDPRRAAALVAVGLIVPGASDPDTLWENIASNKTFFRAAEASDFGAEPSLFYQSSEPFPDKAYSLSGAWSSGRLEDFGSLKLPASFDPSEADLSLLWWLQAARKALENTSLTGHEPGKLGVIAGHVILPTRAMAEAAVSFYGREATRAWEFNPFDPPPKTNHFRAVGYSAKLVAETFGFGGPAFTVDAACASSLYALRLALDRLRDGTLTLAVTGGLAQADPLFTQLGFSQLRALSRTGISRPFSQEADGLVVGSGAVALVLKRLDRAISDGDEIISVITGVGLSNDRTGNLLAPDAEGQERAMRNAFADAHLDPHEAPELFEAHGTSTTLGDTTEISAIKKLLKGSNPAVPPVVGSVKGNLGHLLSAAGAVSIVKTAWAIKNQILPPTAGFTKAPPELNLDKPPALRVLTKPIAWPEPKNNLPRLAAVNAFGFGGVNAQALMEEYVPSLWSPQTAKKPTKAKTSKAAKSKAGAIDDISPLKSDASPKLISSPDRVLTASLISARTVLAPWPNYEHLARYWLTPEEPPLAQTRRLGGLKATGFFFDQTLNLDAKKFHLPPRELAEALPQQTLALKPALAALNAAGLDPDNWPQGIDRNRFGVFMGVDIDPRSADFALRWLAPPRAAAELIRRGLMSPLAEGELTRLMREGSPPPLTHNRVLGSLGSFVASRLARYLGIGGPSFTLSEEIDSGIRALREAMAFLASGQLDLALVGVVDTFGDPKTAALAPKTVWVEGAAALVLASPKAAKILQPLAELTLTDRDERLGPLSGLFALNRNAFYLRHHLKPLGRGHGFCYWLKNPQSPPRSLDGPGYVIVETQGHCPAPLTVSSDPVKPDVWFFVRSSSPEDLKERLATLQNLLDQNPVRDLLQLAREFWNLPGQGKPSLALLVRDARELSSHIKRALSGEVDRDFKPRLLTAPNEPLSGDLAWVFPGSGGHYKGLGRGLAVSFPEVMCELEAQSSDPIGLFQSELLWEPNHKRPTVKEAILGQVAFGLIGASILTKKQIIPQAVLGYSLGEVSALVASNLWPDRDELWRDLMDSPLFSDDLTGELNAARSYWSWPVHKPLRWLTALVPRPAQQAKAALATLPTAHRHRAFLLLVNTREEVVIGGEESSVQALAIAMEAPMFPIEDVASVHSPVVGQVAEKYRLFHTRRTVPNPDLRFYSCFQAKAIEQQSEAIAQSLTDQALYGHCFPDLIEQAYQDGVRFFIEVGPGNSTTRMIKSILGDKPHMAQSLAATAVDEGHSGLYRVLAELWLSGYPLNLDKLVLQLPPEPDQRYLVPIKLAPHPIDWPEPSQAVSPAEAAAPASSTETPSDYLAWLEQQTSELAPIAQKPSGNQEISQVVKEERAHSLGSAASPKTKLRPSQRSKTATRPAGLAGQASSAGQAARHSLAGSDSQASPDSLAGQDSLAGRDSLAGPDGKQSRDFLNSKLAAQNGPTALSGLDPLPPGLGRAECLEFARGSIAKVFGPKFAEIDAYPTRVRLPDEPLMFVDRVTRLEGQPMSLSSGRVVTEHDIKPDLWCVEGEKLTPGMSIESGQADLLLSAWLGIDSATKGLARYRLLDAEVVFHRDLPEVGQTASYDIRLINFFSHAETNMFRFEFDGTIFGHPLLSMRRGCAGFFTPAALAAGKGLPKKAPDPLLSKLSINPLLFGFSGAFEAASLDAQALNILRSGDPAPLGPTFARIKLEKPLLLPMGKLSLIDCAPVIDPNGGAFKSGFIRTESKIDPKSWYLTSHFVGDEVMPGTLMYDACLQSLRLYLLAMGWLGEYAECSFQPPIGQTQSLRCRGQVTPSTKTVAYEVHIKETGLTSPSHGHAGGQPYALAEAIMWADGRPIVEVNSLGLRLAGQSLEGLTDIWSVKKARGRPKGSSTGKKADRLEAQDSSSLDGKATPTKPETVVRRQARTKTVETQPTSGSSQSSSIRRLKNTFFDKNQLTSISTGLLSEAFGPLYARFDSGDFVARLPREPYDFIDEATIRKGRLGTVAPGTQVEALYRPSDHPQSRAWLLGEAGGAPPVLPYAALNEIALQPCGFLAAFMGSALAFQGPMHFRNLGGEAVVRAHPGVITGPLQTRATLTKASVLGSMTIQHYQFSCYYGHRPVYEGQTHFGFHTPESLERQGGLKANPALLKALTSPTASGSSIPYPEGPAWPSDFWRMLDTVVFDPKGDGRIWGRVKVDPKAWFFEAHFPFDPVWPGSLGLEAFIQAAKVLCAQTFQPEVPLSEIATSWSAPAVDNIHRWLYRGQIVPKNNEVTLGLKVLHADQARKALTFSGLLWVDNLVVYQIDDFTVAMTGPNP
ncbi:MAG: hypothetical protein LBE31_09430 [Deltaproteobacteria bacterium]|jgi:acyl transferase domain-containing protein/3-hydroxymyristoyl/3-hydroxydecanoyl-(acyl carrier protein) dehydratase|nr:hypothetical protein [Deltaproteobacteria bacterium]